MIVKEVPLAVNGKHYTDFEVAPRFVQVVRNPMSGMYHLEYVVSDEETFGVNEFPGEFARKVSAVLAAYKLADEYLGLQVIQ